MKQGMTDSLRLVVSCQVVLIVLARRRTVAPYHVCQAGRFRVAQMAFGAGSRLVRQPRPERRCLRGESQRKRRRARFGVCCRGRRRRIRWRSAAQRLDGLCLVGGTRRACVRREEELFVLAQRDKSIRLDEEGSLVTPFAVEDVRDEGKVLLEAVRRLLEVLNVRQDLSYQPQPLKVDEHFLRVTKHLVLHCKSKIGEKNADKRNKRRCSCLDELPVCFEVGCVHHSR